MVPLTFGGPALESFLVYSGILALKVLMMAPLTAKQRLAKNVFANEEDAKSSRGLVKFDDPDVERVRRAHLNDLENIPAFWMVGALYLTTTPNPELAVWLFRVFTAGRLIHTLAYAIWPTKKARGIAYNISNFITWYMGIKVIAHYINAL